MRCRFLALALTGALAAASAGGCGAPETPTNVLRRLDALFTSLHDRGAFDGAVVVGTADAVVWQKGFGYANREENVRFSPDTAVDAASLAKTFTATLLLLLERDGTLGLDDPASRFVPELPYPEVTLRHLLSHTSGIPVGDYDVFDALVPAGTIRTTEVLAAALGKARPPLAFRPGTQFDYNSFGFDLAALAAARAAKRPLAELFRERLLRPLQMTSAFLRPGRLADFPGVRTRGYRLVDGHVVPHEVFDLEAFHGGSNIYISAADLHRFNVSFFGSALLDEDAKRLALQPARIGDAASGLTLGSWYRNDEGTAYWYSGHHQGFHSEVFRDVAARRSIVYVSNNTIAPWLQKSLVRAIASILDGREPDPLEPHGLAVIGTGDRPQLARRWMLEGGGTLELSLDGDALAVRREGARYRMMQVAPDAFYVPGLDLVIGFATSPDGAADRMYVASAVAEHWGRRADGRPRSDEGK